MGAAVEARGLIKRYGDATVVDGIDLDVAEGSIFGILGPNGAGKTTILRMLLGIIEPDGGDRMLLGRTAPLEAAAEVGYMPEERGLYPAMTAREAIAFMGALRGLPLGEGRRRADAMLVDANLFDKAHTAIRKLSKGMAQTVQLLGTTVHRPRLIVLDEPFSGLDAVNQARLEAMIRAEVARGATVIFSTHVIAHAERLCERIAIIAKGRVRFAGTVEEARDKLRPRVRLATRTRDGAWRGALPADAVETDGAWAFDLPASGIETLLAALMDGEAGIESLSIERPGLHEAFVAIIGAAMAGTDTARYAPPAARLISA